MEGLVGVGFVFEDDLVVVLGLLDAMVDLLVVVH